MAFYTAQPNNRKGGVEMKIKELRELDAWIWKTIFNGVTISKGFGRRRIGYKLKDERGEWPNGGGSFGWGWQSDRAAALFLIPSYTTDPAAAMVVLKKCLEKTDWSDVRFWVAKYYNIELGRRSIHEKAETLELAICLFAKKLFTK